MPVRFDVFFNMLKACHDGLAFYPAGNPIVAKQMENFINVCVDLMEGDCLVVTLGPRGFVIGDNPLPHKLLTHPGVGWLSNHLSERHIHTIIFYRGVSIRDVEYLVRVLQTDASQFSGPESAVNLLKHRKIWRVQVNAMPSRISDNPFASLQTDQTLTELSLAMPASPSHEGFEVVPDPDLFTVPQGEIVAPRTLDPLFAPQLPLPLVEQDTLYKAMTGAVVEKNLKRVAETLTLIRADLGAGDSGDRDLAYCSYHVVVKCLVDHEEDASLLIVLKSMSKDFLSADTLDHFTIHLATVLKIMIRFRDAGNLLGIAYGFNMLANLNLRMEEEERRTLVSDALDRLMDLKMVESLLYDNHHHMMPVRKALFHRHGLGILRPLLNALFESEDRNLRKRLLEIITALGTLCYPILMDELRKAMHERRPWFIKRNLLTLLSISPPPELVPMLPELYKEERPKMRDLVVRCLFQVRTPEAFKLGRQMMRDANGLRLMKMLRYIQVSRHGAYASEVMQAFVREKDEKIKKEAIVVLGKIDTDESVVYLGDILDKSGETLVKPSTAERILAAQYLARSKRERSREILIRHKRDFTREVREVVQKALMASV